MDKKIKTDFLFASPSYASGAARLLDLWGTFDEYNSCDSTEEADTIALYSDWAMIGQDIQDAVGKEQEEGALVR